MGRVKSVFLYPHIAVYKAETNSPPDLLSQMQVVPSKLVEASMLPQGDQLTAHKRGENKHRYTLSLLAVAVMYTKFAVLSAMPYEEQLLHMHSCVRRQNSV